MKLDRARAHQRNGVAALSKALAQTLAQVYALTAWVWRVAAHPHARQRQAQLAQHRLRLRELVLRHAFEVHALQHFAGGVSDVRADFDLAQLASVSLTIHDVRGNLVRRLLPRPGQSAVLVPGRYGRAVPSTGLGCNPSFVWDGRADNGTVVARGVYLIRLRAGRTESIKKAVFQGP